MHNLIKDDYKLFEFLPGALIEIDIAEQLIIYMNRMALFLFGYTPDEIESGLMLKDIFQNDTEYDRAVKVAEQFGLISFKDQEEYTRIENQDLYNFMMRKKDGNEFFAECQGSFVLDDKKTPVGVRLYIRDLTKQRVMESALQESEEKYRTLVEDSSDLIYLIDNKGRILSVNKAAATFLHQKQSDIEGKNISELFPRENAEVYQKSIGKAFETGESKTYESVLLIGKQTVWLSTSINPVKDGSGEVTAAFGVSRDITKLKRMEATLQEEAEKYRGLVEKAGIAIIIDDKDGNINYTNERFANIYGYSLEEINQKSIQTLVHPDDVDRVLRHHNDRIRGKKTPTRYEFKGINKDGSILSLETDVTLMREGDEIVGTRSYLWDITDRKQGEEKLLESEMNFRLLADYTYDWEYLLSPEGKYISNSPSCERICGYTHEEFEKDPELLLSIVTDDFHETVSRHYHDEKTLSTPHCEIEFQINHKDGSIKWLNHHCNPVVDHKGNYIGRRGNNRDITDRKQTEIELSQYKYIVSTTSDMMAFVDSNYVYLAANKAYVQSFNKTSEEVVGKTFSDVFGEAFFTSVIKPNADRCLDGETIRYQTWAEYPAHGKRYMDSSYNAHYDSDHKIMGFVITTRDITDRKVAEDERGALESQLRQSQKLEAVGTMAGGIAHDFNNILQGFYLYAGIIKNQLPVEGELRSHFQKIIEAGDRAKELVKQILTFSRKEGADLKPIQIQYLIKDALKLTRASTLSTIEIVEEIDTSCGNVLCDVTQLHQVFVNLCNNSIYAMKENGGVLTVKLQEREAEIGQEAGVSLSSKNKYVELLVGDTGCGMDDELIESIFDPFFTTKDVNEGTGLGLSIVHGIINDMQGNIEVESEPDKGTTIRILMPIYEDEVIGDAEKEADQVKISGLRILYVDDDKMISGAGKVILEEQGSTVDIANDGFEALEMFQKDINVYDLIITDLTMPKMTGLQLVKEVRKLSKNVVILLTSGVVDSDVKKDFEKQGINAFLQKPWVPEKLIQMVSSLIEAK